MGPSLPLQALFKLTTKLHGSQDTAFAALLLKRKLALLPSFSLVFLDLQMKLYLLLANAAKRLQQGF
jgi:hypothetical protein